MDLSIKWLKEFVDYDYDIKEYCSKMTMSGSKVETFKNCDEGISNVVVGKVLEVKPHEDSDHLVICSVDVGKEAPVQIVTGATNVIAGAIVPVALDNSSLPNGVKIKKGKLRGVLSEGMLCSLGELNLTVNDFPYAEEDGIFLIQEDCKIGQDISSAIGLDDTTIEFEITPNRPDCLSIIGLARETAVTYNKPLKLKKPEVKATAGDNINDEITVKVENKELCPRYTARVVKNVKIEPSPRWMRERLRACGVRPINNLVDITNYVMLEYGQPLHAFDKRLVKGGNIIVRNAENGETITTLDGVERKLTEKMLVIADDSVPVAVAGVMGGEYSGIKEDTTAVIFESANFKGSSVRTTARDLAMRTDASSKYEKGLDPQNTMDAVNRACELVELLGAGEVCEGIIDIDNSSYKQTELEFTPEWINEFLNINLSADEMIKILEQLGFGIKGNTVLVPSYRSDVEHKADIAEEIARFYGYDKIPVTAVRGVANARYTNRQVFERKIHESLLACGCYEVSTYSFISPKYYDLINLDENSEYRTRNVKIINPLGEDTSVMRTTTIPSILEVLSHNNNHKNPEFKVYELGNEYKSNGEDKLPDENLKITIGMYGNGDFYSLKAIVEAMLDKAGYKGYKYVAETKNKTFHPGRCAIIEKDGVEIGIMGEIHPSVAENYDLPKTYVAKIDFDEIYIGKEPVSEYQQISRFPATTRDLSLVCDIDMPVGNIAEAISVSANKYLEKLSLFDVYYGEQVETSKKSVSYKLVLRSKEGTLTDVDADNTINKVLKALEKINVKLRT